MALHTAPRHRDQDHEGGAAAPLELLEAEIIGSAASIAAATCAWLLTIAEYDRRRGWETWECRSCSHWLSWRCSISARTAREHVAVAARLVDLPDVIAAFSEGELSYSKVRLSQASPTATSATRLRTSVDWSQTRMPSQRQRFIKDHVAGPDRCGS